MTLKILVKIFYGFQQKNDLIFHNFLCMITKVKIDIYEKYNGFEEAYNFENKNVEVKEVNWEDWNKIDELIGNVILLKNGNASVVYQEKLKEFIRNETENDLVIQQIEKIATQRLIVSASVGR
jgi:hypothetical protein